MKIRTFKILPAVLIPAFLANTSSCASPVPSPSPAHRVELSLTALSREELPESLAEKSVASTVCAVKVRILNKDDSPIKLLWADFFARTPNHPWVGGWWNGGHTSPSDLRRAFEPESAPSTLPLEMAEGEAVSHVMVDPWVGDPGSMEYKFSCLMSFPDGRTVMAESPSVLPLPLDVGNSGVEMVLAGVSSAIKSLAEGEREPASPPSSIGAGLELKALGQVEVLKHSELSGESWKGLMPSAQNSASPKIYAYQVEVANNTPQDLRLVQMVVDTSHSGKWLSGAARPWLVASQEILEKGYLQSLDSSGATKLRKMSDPWLPSGTRAVFPLMWHPQESPSAPTLARWRAILVDRSGNPFCAESQTGEQMCPVEAPPPGAHPAPSPSIPVIK